jgi:hypothetical protein
MQMILRASIFGAALIATIGAAKAATISVLPFGSTGITMIMIDGELLLNDYEKFRQKASTISKALVVFQSDGGNAIAGIEIGKLIRLRNFSTLVSDNMRCASACALAWLGGTHRFMGATARIGFHAVYMRDTGQEAGAGNALVGAYLSQIGLRDIAVYYITQAAPTSMTWLSFADAQKVGIDVSVLEPDEATSLSKPVSKLEIVPPVNLRNLQFENVRISKESENGANILIVEGLIVNIVDKPVEVPRLRFAARNAAGQEVYTWTALPSRSILGPGESLEFRSRLASPPADASDVMVRFFNRQDAIAGSTAGPSNAGNRAPPISVSKLHTRAKEFIAALYRTVSGPTDEASVALNEIYADTVRFYGKEMSREHVITQVQRFLARWPIRQYKPKEGTTIINCDDGVLTCSVTGVMQFDAQSPIRNQRSTGEATFEYLLRFSSYQQMPQIIAEDGKPLTRSVQALSSEANASPLNFFDHR